jgi:hypothetical protein
MAQVDEEIARVTTSRRVTPPLEARPGKLATETR